MAIEDICLFSLESGAEYGRKIAGHLGTQLAEHQERDFKDGEHKVRPLVNVRGRDVFLVQSLHGDTDFSANDKLCWLLCFDHYLSNR